MNYIPCLLLLTLIAPQKNLFWLLPQLSFLCAYDRTLWSPTGKWADLSVLANSTTQMDIWGSLKLWNIDWNIREGLMYIKPNVCLTVELWMCDVCWNSFRAATEDRRAEWTDCHTLFELFYSSVWSGLLSQVLQTLSEPSDEQCGSDSSGLNAGGHTEGRWRDKVAAPDHWSLKLH